MPPQPIEEPAAAHSPAAAPMAPMASAQSSTAAARSSGREEAQGGSSRWAIPGGSTPGSAVSTAEQKAKVVPGAEESHSKDGGLILQQQALYVKPNTAASQASAPSLSLKPLVAQAPARLPATTPSPRPAANPAKPKPASSSDAGPSGSKPSPMDSPSGKSRKFSKSGALRKPRSAFELFASQQRRQASDAERSLDEEPPDLGQASQLPSPVARWCV